MQAFFGLVVVFTVSAASAGPTTRFVDCTSETDKSNVATLTFLNGGNLQWDEEWHSASSIGEPNSSEEFGDIYELTDFPNDDDGGFQLILKPEFVASDYAKGFVEVLNKGQLVDRFHCDNNL